MTRRMQEIVLTGLTAVIALLVILNGERFFSRWDLTRNREQSISDVSRTLFRQLDDTLQITYYVSDRLRARAAEPQQVIDLVSEYAAYGRGSIEFVVEDPVAADTTADIERIGVVPQQIQVIEQDQQSLAVVYTGIVIRYRERFDVIPVVFDPGVLEYQLTSRIKDLIRDEPRSVALLAGSTINPVDQAFQVLRGQLARQYDVVELAPGDVVPAGTEALLLLGGADLSEEQLEPVEAYLSAGGSALFAVDGVEIDIDAGLSPRERGDAPIFSMLAHYGFVVDPSLVLNRSNLRIPVQQALGAVRVQTLEAYPHWIVIPAAAVSTDHPVTARFPGLDLMWASPVRAVDPDARGFTRIVSSALDSWLMNDAFYTDPTQRFLFEERFNETRGQYDLAYAYTGAIDPFFDSTGDATGEARMIVIGDSDFLSDLSQFTGSAHNYAVALNMAEWLSNDEELLEIRTRAARDLRLSTIADPIRFSTLARIAEVINVFLVPLAVVFAGIIQASKRRRSR